MAQLWLLSESDNDDAFFKACVERLIGKSVQLVPRRLRPGSGVTMLRSNSHLMLQQIQQSGYAEETFFLIAWDNDRSPVHPTHERRPGLSKKERQNVCRYCEIDSMIRNILGERADSPILGTVAVPVEMLESWLLLICNAEKYRDEASLPPFPRKDKPLALKYYSRKNPPNQLKDLRDIEMQKLGMDTGRFIVHCASRLDPNDLAARAPSFALFKSQVDSW